MAASARQRKSVAAVHPSIIDEIATLLKYGGSASTRRPQVTSGEAMATAAALAVAAAAEGATVVQPADAPRLPRNKEDDIFQSSSEEGQVAEEGQQQPSHGAALYDPATGTTPALGGGKPGSYFGVSSLASATAGGDADAALASALGVPAHLAALKRKVEKAAQAQERKEAAARKREEDELARSRAAAERETAAPGGFKSYFQRRQEDLAPKKAAFSDADLDFDASLAKAPTEYGKTIVEEDDEGDDAEQLRHFRQGLEVFEDAKQKGGKKTKRARQGKAKQKVNQDMDKITHIIKEKRDDADTLLTDSRNKKQAKMEEEH